MVPRDRSNCQDRISSNHFKMANLLRNIEIHYVILGIDTPLVPDFDSSFYASVKINVVPTVQNGSKLLKWF